MKKIKTLLASVSLAAMVSTSSFAEDVKIGVIYPLTGPVAQVGKDAVAALKTAVDIINKIVLTAPKTLPILINT